MKFKRQNIKDYYLHDTRVENMFINEYMVQAPGNYVKVYLLALMYADINVPLENDIIAKQLSMADEEVLMAWTYWEEQGLIKKHYRDSRDKFNYQVEFLNLRELVYGKKTGRKKSEAKVPEALKNLMEDDTISEMYQQIEEVTGRLLGGQEPAGILSWIEDYGVSPALVVYAYSYCTSNRGNSKYKYVSAVVKEWAEKGLKTVEEAEAYLRENDSRHYLYKRVLKELGFMRNPTAQEKRIMDSWFDGLGFGIEKVLEACAKTSGISSPNINYVNSVLIAWSKGDTGSGGGRSGSEKASSAGTGGRINRVMRSYDEDRAKNEAIVEKRRAEVYGSVPQIREIDEEVRELGFQISKVMLSGRSDAKSKIREMKKRIDRLNEEKAFLMTENNFKIDYMDPVYTCALCRDTGVLDTGERCGCFARKLAEL